MKKHDLVKLAILGCMTAGMVSTQAFAGNGGQGSCGSRPSSGSYYQRPQASGGYPSSSQPQSNIGGGCGGLSNDPYTQYNPANPPASDDQYNAGRTGIRQGTVSNSQRSDQATSNTQTCTPNQQPQIQQQPPQNAVSESKCGENGNCNGYSQGSKNSRGNSALMRAKRSSNRK